jgi:hypothetical protein
MQFQIHIILLCLYSILKIIFCFVSVIYHESIVNIIPNLNELKVMINNKYLTLIYFFILQHYCLDNIYKLTKVWFQLLIKIMYKQT